MTTIVKSLGDFVNLLVQTFNLSTLFPATIFMVLMQMFVLPIVSTDSPLRFIEMVEGDNARLGINLVLIVLLAYVLDAANSNLIRLFEGYPLMRHFPFDWLRQRHQAFVMDTLEEVAKLDRKRVALRQQAAKEQDQTRKQKLHRQADELADRAGELLEHITDKYPEDPDAILPTPFGNVIAAAEHYPYKLLGMDTIVLWPFLRPVLTEKGYAQFVMRDKAMMDFLVNLTVVLMAFGSLFGLADWFYNGLSWELAGKMLLIAGCCYLTYRLSIQGAMGWGASVRTPFVVYREDLRRELQLRPVENYDQERNLWRDASGFFAGNLLEDEQALVGRRIFTAESFAEARQAQGGKDG